jgi:alkyl sulfatase BDS1-like metallo-beta-lactamase superfamily hydrolase
MTHIHSPLALFSLAFLAFLATSMLACGGEQEVFESTAENRAQGDGDATRDLKSFGDDLDAAVALNDFIYQARGTANANMVVTSAGNIIIDTGLPNQPYLSKYLKAVNDLPITHVIATHAHADHYGATSAFAEDGTEIIVHAEFPHNQTYLKALAPTLVPRNRIFFPDDIPPLPNALIAAMYPTIEPTRLVYDEYAFEQGGVRFEVLAMPGAEGSDGLCVWLPDHKILFTGDFYGHIFPMWPNLITIRGERARFPMPYVDSLNRILELDPEMIVGSHFEPIVGREKIREGITRIRDAVLYVHERVIDGINDGKSVHTLMQEISLPESLAIPEVHGKVSWGVRSIYEAYLGWFHLQSSTELYAVPVRVVYPEIVAMGGGAEAFAGAAAEHVEKGEPERALHFAEMAIAAEPQNRDAQIARLAALELLLERSGGVNHYEVEWLKHRIGETRDDLGL